MQKDAKLDYQRMLEAVKDAKTEAMMLEFVEQEDGKMVLRTASDDGETLVSIEFSDKVKDMLGDDAQVIGQHMIHAAIQTLMQKQLSQWHANVYDEEPTHYS